jgi:hypothetical protein
MLPGAYNPGWLSLSSAEFPGEKKIMPVMPWGIVINEGFVNSKKTKKLKVIFAKEI